MSNRMSPDDPDRGIATMMSFSSSQSSSPPIECSRALPSPAGRGPSTWQLLRAESGRQRTLLARYPLEAAVTVVGFACMFLIFAAIGTVSTGPYAIFSGSLQSLALIYVLWTMSAATVVAGASQVSADAAIGVLENLFLSCSPIIRILSARTAARICLSVPMGLVLLAAFCLGTAWAPPPVVVAAMAVAALACGLTGLGLGFAFAGAALVTKRIVVLGMPVNFLCMLAFMSQHAAAGDRLDNPVLYLPFVAAATLVRRAVELGRFEPVLVAQALVGVLVWVPLGRLVLARCVQACRRVGSVNLY
ncbi:MAG TPA: hypothetical protein VF453_08145 [Burkholderiaceae bacterium]